MCVEEAVGKTTFSEILLSITAALVHSVSCPSQANNDQLPLFFEELAGIMPAHHSKLLLLTGTVNFSISSFLSRYNQRFCTR